MKQCRKCGVPLTKATWYDYEKKHGSLLCKKCRLELFRKRYHGKDHDAFIARRKGYTTELRLNVLKGMGGKCKCCGEAELKFLGIDHIHNDGAKERREIGKGLAIYRRLRKMGFKSDRHQILCHNCNLAKGFYGECPHEKAMDYRPPLGDA